MTMRNGNKKKQQQQLTSNNRKEMYSQFKWSDMNSKLSYMRPEFIISLRWYFVRCIPSRRSNGEIFVHIQNTTHKRCLAVLEKSIVAAPRFVANFNSKRDLSINIIRRAAARSAISHLLPPKRIYDECAKDFCLRSPNPIHELQPNSVAFIADARHFLTKWIHFSVKRCRYMYFVILCFFSKAISIRQC